MQTSEKNLLKYLEISLTLMVNCSIETINLITSIGRYSVPRPFQVQ